MSSGPPLGGNGALLIGKCIQSCLQKKKVICCLPIVHHSVNETKCIPHDPNTVKLKMRVVFVFFPLLSWIQIRL